MQRFEGISFLWALIIIAAIALVYGLRALIGYRNVLRDAQIDYSYKSSEGMIDTRLSKDGYIRAYKRFNAPRSTAFVAAGLTAMLVLTLPALYIIEILLEQFWIFMDKSRTFEPGFLVWQFLIFFSLIGVWAFIGYQTARLYHGGKSISFNDEILKEIDKEGT